MFHKALWMRDYKQGKVAIWLLWVVSLLFLPISYALEANRVSQWMTDDYFIYFYHFDYGLILLPLGGLSILLACILIGGERSNQGMDLMFAMPFKRRDIFLSKWFMGAANIAGITLINMVLMFIIQKTTIHGEHQTFAPFLNFFLFMFIILLAIYSLSLFIGTITGGYVSQALLTIVACILPIGLFTQITGVIEWHIMWLNGSWNIAAWFWRMHGYFSNISIFPTIVHPWFAYEQLPVGSTVASLQSYFPSRTTYLALLLYIVASFLLGLLLFKRTPSENNGKIILYKKLEPIFLWCTVVCCALLGGTVGSTFFWDTPLIGFYLGVIPAGIICYIVLSGVMKKPLKYRKA